jgi:hypothetical protein
MRVVPEKSPLLWTRGVAARETLSYLDRKGIDAKPALLGAGLSRRQLSRDDIGVSAAAQYRFLELAATEANDPLLGLHVAAEMAPSGWRASLRVSRKIIAGCSPLRSNALGRPAVHDVGPGLRGAGWGVRRRMFYRCRGPW